MYEQLKLDNQLCFRLYTAARMIAGAYNPYFEQLGITYPQYLVLLVLWEKDQQPVNDIAKRLLIVCLTPQAIAMREQAKEIPANLGNEIGKYVSMQELQAMIPALDKLIEGLQQTNK